MPASLISIDGRTVTVEVKVELSRSMLTTEEAILSSLGDFTGRYYRLVMIFATMSKGVKVH
jgi:hypothetical protein